MWRLGVAVIAAALSVILTGCGGSDPQLDALRADPMARWAPSGSALVSRFESPSREQSSSEKPRLASIARTIRVEGDVEEMLADGERAAEAAQWSRTEDSDLRFTKSGAGFAMTLSILAAPGSERDIVVTLRAVPSVSST